MTSGTTNAVHDRTARRVRPCGVVLLLVSLAPLVGCRTLWNKSPVAENVVEARQLSMQGLDLMAQQRWDEAERVLSNAIKSCPLDERARKSYAEVLWHKDRHEEALKHMTEAVRLSGGDAVSLARLGEMYLTLGNLQQADSYVLLALAANRQLPQAWTLRGEILARQGQDEQALAAYHRALALQDPNTQAQLAVARIYQRLGRPQRTLATLQSLLEQSSKEKTPDEAYVLQGLAFKSLGRYDDAIEALARATRNREPNAEALFHLSEAQYLLGDVAAAHATVQQAAQRFPYDQALLQLRSRISEADTLRR